MNQFQVEVAVREGFSDPTAVSVMAGVREFGIETVKEVRTVTLYLLEGELDRRSIFCYIIISLPW